MKLVELKTSEFVGTVASSEPAPGGGSVAALTGALSAALAEMVCTLTKTEDLSGLKAEAAELKEKLLVMTDKDTEAFMKVANAFSMPKETDDEKAARSAAIQDGLLACLESPREVMLLARDAIRVIQKVSENYNTNAASDLGVAALSAEAAAKGAWLNVLINAGSLKDKEKGAAYKTECEEVLREVEEGAKKVYAGVLEEIGE